MKLRKLKAKKKSLNIEAIKANLQQDEEAKYRDGLNGWLRGLLAEHESGRLPKEAVALEGLMSVFDAFQKGLTHESVADSYPVKAWREETATVPVAWLRVIVDAWAEYVKSGPGQTFGKCMKLEDPGQGTSPVKNRLAKYKEERSLSNEVLVNYLIDPSISFEQSIGEVADARSISDSKVKRASEKFRFQTVEALSVRGFLVEKPLEE